jgi:hypothetical protein
VKRGGKRQEQVQRRDTYEDQDEEIEEEEEDVERETLLGG